MYLHCNQCLKELPPDTSPQEYSNTQTGFTKQGLQVWCNRHKCNVVHIDFECQQHPANITCKILKKLSLVQNKESKNG